MPRDTASGRLEFVDALRGFALFGVFGANLLIFAGFDYLTDAQRVARFPSALDRAAFFLERFFIETKFMGLFSLLFGISFWLFLDRVSARTSSPTRLFYRRIFWLFVIGCLHGWLLWGFDILRFYALWAILLPLFVRMPARRLLLIALAFCVVIPPAQRTWFAAAAAPGPDFDAMALAAFSSGTYREVLAANWAYDWHLTFSPGQPSYQLAVFGRLLLGLWVARSLDLGNLEAHRALLRRVFPAALLAGAAGSAVSELKLFPAAHPFLRRLVAETGLLGFTLAYASGLALLYLAARWAPRIRLLAPMGRMALTWYLLQTVFGIWLFYGFAPGPGLMGRTSPALLFALTFAGFAAQVALADVWMRRFRFGPAEWVWRSLTYGRVEPFRLPESR